MVKVHAYNSQDVVGQAGAYFALVQLISWMISGVAWST